MAAAAQLQEGQADEDDGVYRKETIEMNWRPGDDRRGHSRSPGRSPSPGRRGGLRPGTALPRRASRPADSGIPFGRHSNSPEVNYELMSDAARPFRVRSPSRRDQERVAEALKDLLAHKDRLGQSVVDAFQDALRGTIVDACNREVRSDQVLGIAPVLAERLGLPEWVFDGLEGVVQNFDFDGNGMTDELEAKRMFEVWLTQKMIELGGRVEDPPEKTPQEAGYYFEKEIGRGAHGIMYLCEKGDDKYCVKQVSKVNLTANKIEEVLNEFGTMFRMNSPFIARTFEVFQDGQAFYVVNELYSGGDFTKLGKNAHDEGQTMSESWWRNIFKQCLLGLQYLHEKGVLHCDIKEPNIMVASSDSYARPRPVFIDFGLCLRLSNNRGAGGTPGYMPPETYEEEQWYPRGDVFSLGIVFFQLMTGQVPSKDGRRPGVLYGNGNPRGAAIRGSLPWERFPDMLLLKDLVSWMTQRIRIQRPRTFQAVSHPWFGSSGDAPLPAEALRGLVSTETALETGAELAVKDFVRSPRRQGPRPPSYSLADVHSPRGRGACGAAPDGLFGASSAAVGSPRLGWAASPPPAAQGLLAGGAPQPGAGAGLAGPPEVHVRLTRVAAARLGITVDEDQPNGSLILSRVEPGGLLAQWNLSSPASALQPGDRIVAVNNVRGDVGAMCGQLADSLVVDLVCRTR
ncbi:unnamed protein product [Prorocentrum cordatum]|uniref:Non-specific serine/threonine protein kinase n=1 Tax=Prorocentrum cordatum TaxID=2364126 RepID=A0ABN9VES8_9DINO|nr:unnamed protein product [Polarella glacialis]